MYAMSYLRGSTDDPLLDVTFGQLLDDTAARWPDREAYVFKKTGSRITFAEIRDKASRLAAGLRAIGTGQGDVVAWLFGNRPEWIYMYFAVAKLGAIAMPLVQEHVGRDAEIVCGFLKKAGVKVFVVGDILEEEQADATVPFLRSLFPEIQTVEPGKLNIEKVPTLTCIVVLGDKPAGIGAYSLDEVERMGRNENVIEEVRTFQGQASCRDTFIFGFTSGTTDEPKLVEQSTYGVHNSMRFLGKAVGMPNEGPVLHPQLKTKWAVIYPFTAGCTSVVPASLSPSSVDIMEIIQEERCQSICMWYLKQCYEFVHDPHLKEYDLSSLKQVVVTGNVASQSLLDHSAKVLPNATIFVSYGGTEFMSLTSTTADMSAEQRRTTVGKLSPHLEMQLVDQNGQTVPLGHEGEVCVRGYSVFARYRGDQKLTASVKTADGWLKTGDVGVLDEHGILKLVGRRSDVIIRNAFSVYPVVIESSLMKHPKVQDVRVVGVPDPANVEEICACIILKEGQTANSEDMKNFCAEIVMPTWDTPGYFLFMSSFPMTVTQTKVDRKKLRLIATERLGVKDAA